METSNPSEYSPKFHALPEYLALRAVEISQRVKELRSKDEIRKLVDDLNQDFNEYDLLGKSMWLSSDLLCVTESDLRDVSHRSIPVYDPAVLARTSYIGSFQGVSVSNFDSEPELMYAVEMPLDETTLRCLSASAPVGESRLEVYDDASTPMATDKDADYQTEDLFETLRQPNDASYQGVLREFIEILENTVKVDAKLLQLLGEYAATMLSYPEVSHSPAHKQALCQVFAELLNFNVPVTFAGLEMYFGRQTKKTKFQINRQTMFYGHTHLVRFVRDFDYTTEDDGSSRVHVRQTDQPALVAIDGSNNKRILPLRYLTTFTPANKQDICDEFRDRFLKVNSLLFTRK